MIYGRKADEYLQEWADSPRRKPLVLRGARQVGKSTLVRRFGKSFDFLLEVNLERDGTIVQLFETAKSVDSILEALKIKQRLANFPGKTLLFIDEIQNSPRAIWMLWALYKKTIPLASG